MGGYENCKQQYTKKYISRPGPPWPANQCCGVDRRGNDSQMYRSTRNSNGICTWKPMYDGEFNREFKRSKSSKPASKKPASKKPASKKPASRKPVKRSKKPAAKRSKATKKPKKRSTKKKSTRRR